MKGVDGKIRNGGTDNSVHHTVINTSQESCTTVLLAAFILGRGEKGKEALNFENHEGSALFTQ